MKISSISLAAALFGSCLATKCPAWPGLSFYVVCDTDPVWGGRWQSGYTKSCCGKNTFCEGVCYIDKGTVKDFKSCATDGGRRKNVVLTVDTNCRIDANDVARNDGGAKIAVRSTSHNNHFNASTALNNKSNEDAVRNIFPTMKQSPMKMP
ncbi:hypothetical protein E6O75_ATG03288 [Venturia nashicola]|uniref:Uncharacterized protein n=1 Tax=Venturia nashicola TaxID=86259 RepID=A0A4Z1PMD8_9PEZI|nr:hypothetical protein E6O75_ATG03288 [Venturia nashicola]